MTQFSLSGKDLPHVADLLAAGAGKAMGSVDDLGMALNQAGLIARRRASPSRRRPARWPRSPRRACSGRTPARR
jgi:hypothetical protein